MRSRDPATLLPLSHLLLLVLGSSACAPADEVDESASDTSVEAVATAETSGMREIHVTARDYAFEAPDSLPAGWTTFRMTNRGEEEHFMYMYRLPAGKSFEEFLEEFYVPFGTIWGAYASGEISRTAAEERLVAELPGWFFTDVVPAGGPALTEPGERAVSTVWLEPGTYVMECYVKSPDGTWHTDLGMQRTFTVRADGDTGAPPVSDVAVTLTNYEISAPDTLSAGEQIVAVKMQDRPEGFMPHDVNLFRIDAGASEVSPDQTVAGIVEWMDWMELDQFRAPAPGVSLGGMEHLASGSVGYVHLDLEPGTYAWVSEGYGARGMTRTFVVR